MLNTWLAQVVIYLLAHCHNIEIPVLLHLCKNAKKISTSYQILMKGAKKKNSENFKFSILILEFGFWTFGARNIQENQIFFFFQTFHPKTMSCLRKCCLNSSYMYIITCALVNLYHFFSLGKVEYFYFLDFFWRNLSIRSFIL